MHSGPLILTTICLVTQGYTPIVRSHELGLNFNLSQTVDTIQSHLIQGADKLLNKIGTLQCNGIDDKTPGFHFFRKIFGNKLTTTRNNLCETTCDGSCIPFTNFAETPSVISYAFGCKCPLLGCSARGPKTSSIRENGFRVMCESNSSCSCEAMRDPSVLGTFVPQKGYLCHWYNDDLDKMTTWDDIGRKGALSHLPIRWCACCPPVFP